MFGAFVVRTCSALSRGHASRRKHVQLCRGFASSIPSAIRVHGLIYDTNGEPHEQIRAHSWSLPALKDDEILLRMGLASVNPADVNVIQGVYPAKPQRVQLEGQEGEVFVGGNEGYAIVEEVRNTSKEEELRPGDWVTFAKPQIGTWRSHIICRPQDVIKIDRSNAESLTPVMASTLQVNPPTALRMLTDFVKLEADQHAIIQNTANSAVGQLVAQMASRKFGVPSINLVRDRPDLDKLKASFAQYGSGSARAHVFTYEALADRQSGAKEAIKEILGKRKIMLGLNAVCGKDNANMVKFLAPDSTLITYGAMSKQPLSLPAGLVIFSNVAVRGFMMNKWYAQHSRQERHKMLTELVSWYENGIIEPPPHTIKELNAQDNDTMTKEARAAIKATTQGRGGKKVFFRFSDQ
jgi:NADPH:quinone reductase-like Zn-dependent oxidoreductase